MNTYEVKSTTSTPYILFNFETGYVSMEGRSYVENPFQFYRSLSQQLKNFTSKSVEVNIYIDYSNTISTKCLLEFLKNVNKVFLDIHINWYFDNDDNDMYDTGIIFKSILNCDFDLLIKDE